MASSAPVHKMQYDVFLSFRGSEHRGFHSHLSKALDQLNIGTFEDQTLERGKDLTKFVFEGIEKSVIALVIFSQNYAYSRWCLDELVQIVECRNTIGQITIPVFYGVDPSDVVDLRGKYGDAFAQHRTRFDESLVQRWRHALIDIAMLSGLSSYGFRTDSKLIKKIIICILERLNWLSQSDSSSGDDSVENASKHYRSKGRCAKLSFSASVSAPSSSSSKMKREVFISFRGKDVRANFLSHLTEALKKHRVDVFVDKELMRGENISKSLLEIIEGSYISVVILSEDFAYSVYCMKELVKILECKERNAQIVIPVFYGIDPDDVAEVASIYEDAIAQGRQEFQDIEGCWCPALREIVAVSGFVSSHFKFDSDLVEVVTRDVLEKLNHVFSSNTCYDDGLVGIDSRVENVVSLLHQQDVCMVGICGPGGIGKTTIARATFDRIYNEFESYCFVENVREKSQRYIDVLRNEILHELIGAEPYKSGNTVMMSSSFIRGKLSMKRFLLVLDDVNDFNQIKFIIGNGVSYGSGSKIIVTSSDKHLLNYMGAVMYEAGKLDPDESLRLFCFHAFKQKTPPEGYSELCMRAIAYAQGLPLDLEALGFKLYQRSVDEWRAELDEFERLKDMPSKKTQRISRNTKDLVKITGSYLFLLLASLLWKIKIMLNFRKQAA